MQTFKEVLIKLKEIIFKSKINIVVIIGVIGIVLIFLSNLLDANKNNRVSFTDTSESITDDYSDNIERKLESVISDMLGGTEVQVLVTLESSAEYIYANETKTDVGVTEDRESQKNQQSDSNEKKYVLMKDSDGNEKALVVCKKMPEVRGVVVVCESGQTEAVAAAVRLAVKSALQVDENKICIIGRYK